MYTNQINKVSGLSKTFHAQNQSDARKYEAAKEASISAARRYNANKHKTNSAARNYEAGKEATISAARKHNKTLVSQLKSTYYGLINKAKKALGISTIRN